MRKSKQRFYDRQGNQDVDACDSLLFDGKFKYLVSVSFTVLVLYLHFMQEVFQEKEAEEISLSHITHHNKQEEELIW